MCEAITAFFTVDNADKGVLQSLALPQVLMYLKRPMVKKPGSQSPGFKFPLKQEVQWVMSVSYTHLTLPTKA